MINTGGQAPNQNRGRHPWLVVSTNALAKTVTSKYPSEYPTWNIPGMIPRVAGGQSSIAVAAAFPYSPPIAMPKSARQARKELYSFVKPVANSREMNKTLLKMKGHLRPYLSAATPKITDSTERSMRTSVIPQVIPVFVLSNCFAICETVKLTVKKSKESHVHPRNPTCEESMMHA
jgi:hypothetical protein